MNWDLPQEAKQALELLGKWRPMDVEDSLELLSSQFTNPTVRRYAVARLQQADDEVGVTASVVTFANDSFKTPNNHSISGMVIFFTQN